MPILDPVSPFLALIDRLISLLKQRKTRRREYFEKIIDPLYVHFTPLGEDYLKLFRIASRETLDRHKRVSKERVAIITAKREEFAASRTRLRALLQACERNATKQKDEDLVAFLRAMLNFFTPMVETASNRSRGRGLVDFLGLWTYGERGANKVYTRIPIPPGPDERQWAETDFYRYVRQAIAELESSWQEIAGRYMDLKLKYLDD